MVEQKYVLRASLLYDYKQGKSAADSHRTLCLAFGANVLSESQCRRWFQRFRDGNENLEDEEHDRRPPTVDDNELKQAIEDDPTMSTRELATIFGCSNSTIDVHLKAIGKENRCGKWIPHQLSEANKATRVTMCGILINSAKNSGFFETLLTSDEKWVRFDNITRKRQWLSPGETAKPTHLPDIHGKKVLLSIWWNVKGVVHYELLKPTQTITSDLYSQQLDRVDDALRRQGVDTSKTRLLHDNARPHIAKMTQKKLEELGWSVLPHPPYSPDIAPSDYHLFRSMQHGLAEQKFSNIEEINKWLCEFFTSKPAEFYDDGIRALRKRWRMVIDNNGEYILE